MSFSKSNSSNSNRQAPSAFSSRPPRAPATSSAFGSRNTEGRREAPSAFGGGSGNQGRREAPAAFSSGTRVWKNEDGDAPSAFGRRSIAQRDAPAAFGGGVSGEERKRRLEEKAAEGRYRAEQAAVERKKAAEEEERRKKAMDLTCEEYYPTLGASGVTSKKAGKTSTVVIDMAAPTTEVAAPTSKWAAKKAPEPVLEPTPTPKASGWGAGPTMAQRVAEAAARVDAEAALKRMREEEEAAYRNASRATTSFNYIPRRTLDDGFDEDDAYVGQSYEEDEEAEFNAELYSGRRRGDKGVW